MSAVQTKMDPTRTVHFKGLGQDVTRWSLKSECQKIGEVTYCFFSETSDRFANVSFANPDDAEKAINKPIEEWSLAKDEGFKVEQFSRKDPSRVQQRGSSYAGGASDPDRDSNCCYDAKEDNDARFGLTTEKLDQWIKSHKVEVSVLKENDENGRNHRYSTTARGSPNKFSDGDSNARKLRREVPDNNSQPEAVSTPGNAGPSSEQLESNAQFQGQLEASKTEEAFTNDYWETYLEYIMEKKLLSGSDETFVFTNKALRAIASTHKEAENPYDRGSKLAIQKIGTNYLVRALDTNADKDYDAKNRSQVSNHVTQGKNFEEDYTEGGPKQNGVYWYSVVSRQCSFTTNDGQPLKCQVIVQSEIDAYYDDEAGKKLVEMKSTQKPIEKALGYKSFKWWLQCDFANVNELFWGEVDKSGSARRCESFSFAHLRDKVSEEDRKKAEAAIFKFIEFATKHFADEKTYVVERRESKKTFDWIDAPFISTELAQRLKTSIV